MVRLSETERPPCRLPGGSANWVIESGSERLPVTRATLYFLIRYPEVAFPPDRVPIRLCWHHAAPPTAYEFHRNREIFLKQGNRNPFIDHPEWASAIG